MSLATKGLVFEYAIIYAHNHEQIGPAKDFKISDQEYEEFVKWLKNKDYDYTTKVEKTIEDLKKYSKTEKYFDDIAAEIEDLESKVAHNKEHDLKEFSNEIKSLLEERIAEHYYLMDGNFETSFDNDNQVSAAIDILNNQEEYNSLLGKAN